MGELFYADINDRGMVLDPRTKLFAMITLIVFVVGGAGKIPNELINLYAMSPLVLLLLSKQIKIAVKYGLIFGLASFVFQIESLHSWGALGIIITMSCVIITKIIPGLIMGAYIFSSTTVSEFIAALQRLHVGNKFSVPISVMFRFLPTVIEEFHAINNAMLMRNVRLGKKGVGKLIEYRLVPLIVCSVNIGNEIAEASLTRGLSADTHRTNVCKIGFKLQDLLVFIIYASPYAYVLLKKVGII